MSIILLLNSTKLIKGIFLNVAHWMLYINIYLCVCTLLQKVCAQLKNKINMLFMLSVTLL